MSSALLFIMFIILSGLCRAYLHRKYDVSDHKDELEQALERNEEIRLQRATRHH